MPVTRAVLRAMLRWTRSPAVRRARFSLPSPEASGAVNELLYEIALRHLGRTPAAARLRPRGAEGCRAAVLAAFRHGGAVIRDPSTGFLTLPTCDAAAAAAERGLDLAFEVLRGLPALAEAIAEQGKLAEANASRGDGEVRAPCVTTRGRLHAFGDFTCSS